MTYLVERDEVFEANFEIKTIQGVQSVDLTVYYWEKYDQDTGDEYGVKIDIEAASVHFSDAGLEADEDALVDLFNAHKTDLFSVTYAGVDMWNQEKFEACIAQCIEKTID